MELKTSKFVILIFVLAPLPPSRCQDEGDSEVSDEGDEGEGPAYDDTTPQPSDPDSEMEVKNCGGVLTGRSGLISYKMGQLFDNNERCTWTVYAADASTITFTLQEDGLIQKIEDTIRVGYFKNFEFNKMNSFKEIPLIPFDVNKTATIEGPLAFVRFFSDTKIRGMGFKISFTANNIRPLSNLPIKYTNQFYKGDYGTIKYAPSEEIERVTFTIKPTMDVTLALKYFNGNCMGLGSTKDSLSIFKWGRSSKQEFLKEVCNWSATNGSPVLNWKVDSFEEILIILMINKGTSTNELQIIWAPM